MLSFNQNKIEFDIAGARYYSLSEETGKPLKISDNLELEKDIENKYAMKVLYKYQKYEGVSLLLINFSD